jgi:hypothetical protein
MKTKALTPTELIAVVVTIVLLAGVLLPAANRSRQTAVRLICRTNLKGLASAMREYAIDNLGDYPRAGAADGEGQYWSLKGVLYRFDAPDRKIVFRIRATITSSLYLLVKFGYVPTSQYICPGDFGATTFKLSYFRTRVDSLFDVWDFGGGEVSALPTAPAIMPGEYCSYAYHMPYVDRPTGRAFPLVETSYAASPVCADRSPFLDKNAADPNVGDNSACHESRGQNVLFKDGSVSFVTEPTVGIKGDNIYTYGGDPAQGGGDPNGTPPVNNGHGAPAGRKDAYLVIEKNYRG